MSRKQVLWYYGIDNSSSLNLMNCEHADYNSPSETQHLKEGAVQNFSRFSCPPIRSFPYPLKRPKVYATRDFPERCVALDSQINVKGSEGSTNVVTAEHSLASYSRNSDTEYKTNAHHLNEVLPPSITQKEEEKKAASLSRLKQRKHHAFVKSVDGCNDIVVGNDEEPNYNLNANEAKNKVKETLNLFRELYTELSNEHKAERKGAGTGRRRFDVEAADRLKKKGKWIHSVKRFGHIPGIAIGDQFHYRAELAVVGLHWQYVSGIDYLVLNGKKFATSIVDSGEYENKAKSVDVLIYSGQGGHVGWGNKVDQKLERGNLALVNSKEKGHPVRVIKKNTLVMNDKWGSSYTYDGLYVVNRFWQERDHHRKLVFKFELIRMSSQERPSYANAGVFRKLMSKECCVVDDVSRGKENMAIRAMNGIDGERPQTFAYTTSMIYPEWCKQVPCRGCDCTDGCSNSEQCLCVLKNGGEIPFSAKGTILRGKDIVYECGPSCKCPPSCMNRVSQHGLRYRLELYKTESRFGWGVRSPSYISLGSFVCEYVGELQEIKEERRVSGFRIDAKNLGNVGRFVSHGSSSNLFVQRILYDHEDDRVPHVMLFAAKNIRPSQGLSCDFNSHRIDQISEFQYQLQL